MRYRIKEYHWLDKETAETNIQFFVQEKKKFLFFEWWRTLQPKIFKSYSEAKEHIEKLEDSHARKSFVRYYYQN